MRHNMNGSGNPRWNGGRYIDHGYVKITMPEHPRADSCGYVQEHIVIAERALGRLLDLNNEVHHINCVKGDNRNENLVICEDRAYHFLLHKRLRALKAGVPVHWMKCAFCKKYASPDRLYVPPSGAQRQYHRECKSLYRKVLRAKILN